MFVTDSGSVAAEPLNLGGAQGSHIKWLVGPAQGAGNFAMRLVTVAPGGQTPSHAHGWEHQWFVLAGEGEAVDAYGQKWPVGPGAAVFVPDNEKHCLLNTGDAPLSLICMIRCTPESVAGRPAAKGCG